MLQATYKDDALGKTQMFEWFFRFRKGQMSIDNQPHSGRPPTFRTDKNVYKIRIPIHEDSLRTIYELVQPNGVILNLIQLILSENLGMKSVAAKFVLRLPTAEQKQNRMETS